jgi:hypothetical protein
VLGRGPPDCPVVETPSALSVCPSSSPVAFQSCFCWNSFIAFFVSVAIVFALHFCENRFLHQDESGCSDQPAHGKVVSLAGDVVVEGQPTFLRSLDSAFWRGPGWPQPG